MIRLVYVSSATKEMSQEELVALLRQPTSSLPTQAML